ncbi:MAG: hypothetical protein BJ554DRAFT_8311 [Olpidium bornovanus]|uniref:Uncharacterized protein n=1 Tax=Olpidium bornovanus TaxID=278681 RepID=A0A8H7ZV52_9FUNG|nr:MAG: hypothetical protein BJ554DRAFT_8311 [Olpidium bornovanus]
MVDGGGPPQKLSRKRKADQHDAAGENPQEAHGRRAHHRLPSSSARGGLGGADAHRADVSDSELDGLDMPEMVHRYHILKAKYTSIRRETEVLSKSYGHVRRRLRRLKTEKDVLLDSLIATTRSTIDTWRRTAAEAKAQREQGAPEDTPMRLSAE